MKKRVIAVAKQFRRPPEIYYSDGSVVAGQAAERRGGVIEIGREKRETGGSKKKQEEIAGSK